MRSVSSTALGLLALCLLTVSARAAERPGIVWHSNIFQAYKLSMEKKVPLVVHLYHECGDGDRCPCQKLKNGPLASPEFAEYSDRAVFAAINVDLDDAHGNVKKFVESLGVKDVPCVVVVECATDKIQEIGRVSGYFDTPIFIRNFDNVFAKVNKPTHELYGLSK